MSKSITIETTVNAPIEKVWAFWNEPHHITNWDFAASDWECPAAENDLRVGGHFKVTMGAKDKSVSFDFTGTYSAVEQFKHIAYTITDGRHVDIHFKQTPGGIHITETFDMEHENPEEMQHAGWQAILNNFKNYVESAN